MIKVFISQPMRGKTDGEIKGERLKAIEHVKEKFGDEIEVINPIFEDCEPTKNKPLKLLARSIDLLAEADIAYFAEGWYDARGCTIEHECAHNYGIDVYAMSYGTLITP